MEEVLLEMMKNGNISVFLIITYFRLLSVHYECIHFLFL